MTKEELEKEAVTTVQWECTQMIDRPTFINGYITGAEPREKRIEELEKKLTEKVTLESLDVVSRKIADLEEAKANLEYLLEGRDNEIEELEKENKVLAQNLEDTEILNKTYEKRFSDLEKENAELKEFYEKEYFEIADRTADEKIKELEKYQTEVTIDDYSPYDENTWGMMHEEMFVPKELVRDLLKESYALSEHRNDQLTKAKEIIKDLLNLPFASNEEVFADVGSHLYKAEQFLKYSEVEK